MGRMMIVNGSPRAPKSNSKRYAAILKQYWAGKVDEYEVTSKKHEQLCKRLSGYSDVVLVFPLYADGLPVMLMGLLKELESFNLEKKPTFHVLINCGFLEPEQNAVAVDMIRYFCHKYGYPYGVTLCIGSGEAILSTPFRFLAKRKIKKMARLIKRGSTDTLLVTMPVSKNIFLSASTKYWLSYGEKYNISREEMDTMEIEGKADKISNH